jgi:hypothetical protein
LEILPPKDLLFKIYSFSGDGNKTDYKNRRDHTSVTKDDKLETQNTIMMKKKLLFLLKHLLLTVMLSGSIVAFGQTEVTYTFSDHYSNAVEIGSGSIEGNLDFLAEKNSSSTNPTYYTSGSAARFYYNSGGNGGSYTITAKNGVTITAIELYAVSSYTPAVKYILMEEEILMLLYQEQHIQ